MPNDRDDGGFRHALLEERLNPEAPPPMPRVHPAPAPMPEPTPAPEPNQPTAAPAPDVSKPANSAPSTAPPAGWELDDERIGEFTKAVDKARDMLKAVQSKVDAMRTDKFTPYLGTSPVGQQLEQKFSDRLDAPLDYPERPSTGGLRPMLDEAMRRMEAFIGGAEAAIKAYKENEDAAVVRATSTGQNSGTPAPNSPPRI
jgi:hypothetical protein